MNIESEMADSNDDLPFHEILIEACDEIKRGEAPCLELLVDAKAALNAYALLLARNPRLSAADRNRCITSLESAATKIETLSVVRKILKEA